MLRVPRLLPLFLLLALTACDSSTDLTEVSVQGRWDGVGGIQESAPGLRLFIQESANGTISGSWTRSQAGLSGSVSAGQNENGVVQFRLEGHPGGPLQFEGRLTDRYRMEGTLGAVTSSAVFRRSSFNP